MTNDELMGMLRAEAERSMETHRLLHEATMQIIALRAENSRLLDMVAQKPQSAENPGVV
jgi:hypothetical protein